MNGDNELEPSITGGVGLSLNPARKTGKTVSGDFHSELAALGSNSDVHVVALVDRSPKYAKTQDNWCNTRLYYIEKGDNPDNDGTYWVNATGFDEMNMADPANLVWFIKTVEFYFPSNSLYLSLWDHNWGWHPGWFQKDESSHSATMTYSDLQAALDETKVSIIDILRDTIQPEIDTT
jgi:Clostripain family